jgi:SAM-dependent methyltransferase
VLAGLDVNVTATDQASPDAGWVTSGQYAGQKTKLYYPQYCTPQQFDTYVRYAHADMRHPPCDEHLAQFDFVWSLNSLDHLGSIEAANRFIFDSLKCLKPGGRAVHTTEFSVFPESPVREGGTIFYARECWTELLEALTAANYTVTMDWDLGSNPLDYWVDVPPYSMQHMKLHFEGRVCTSVLLVVDKPA